MTKSTNDEMTKGLFTCLGVLFFVPFCLVAAGTFVWGYTIAVLWNWFAVPILALPVLSIAQGAGINLLVGALVCDSEKTTKDRTTKECVMYLANALLARPGGFLLVGWCIKMWMGA